MPSSPETPGLVEETGKPSKSAGAEPWAETSDWGRGKGMKRCLSREQCLGPASSGFPDGAY